MLAIAAHKMKNDKLKHVVVGDVEPLYEKELYVTIPSKNGDIDYHVIEKGDTFSVTDLSNKQSKDIKLTGYNFEHYSLIELKEDGNNTLM